MKSWIILIGAILLEVAGTTSMKLSDGFSKLLPSILIFVFYGFSFVALTLCIKHIDVSVAYAVWAGVGTALIAVIGVAFFEEPVSTMRILSLGLIILGVIGLNLSGAQH